MRFILMANILEHPSFFNFVEFLLGQYPEINFMSVGDILNFFPETRENLKDSILHEVYGRLVLDEMDNVLQLKFKKCKNSPFTKPLEEMCLPTGECVNKVRQLAFRRYERFFSQLAGMLDSQNKFYFIPGDMDYPSMVECVTHLSSHFCLLDNKVEKVGSYQIAGCGGMPESAYGFPHLATWSPNDMANSEYRRRLNQLKDVDVLLTHVAPEESPELMDFVKKSAIKLLICRSPFNYKRPENLRGELEISTIKDKTVIKIRPFETFCHKAYMIDLFGSKFDTSQIKIVEWEA